MEENIQTTNRSIASSESASNSNTTQKSDAKKFLKRVFRKENLNKFILILIIVLAIFLFGAFYNANYNHAYSPPVPEYENLGSLDVFFSPFEVIIKFFPLFIAQILAIIDVAKAMKGIKIARLILLVLSLNFDWGKSEWFDAYVFPIYIILMLLIMVLAIIDIVQFKKIKNTPKNKKTI